MHLNIKIESFVFNDDVIETLGLSNAVGGFRKLKWDDEEDKIGNVSMEIHKLTIRKSFVVENDNVMAIICLNKAPVNIIKNNHIEGIISRGEF